MKILKQIWIIGLLLAFGIASPAQAGWWADWRKESYEGYTPFHKAAQAGDVEKLADYLEKGEDINQRSRSAQCTALGCAVRWRKHKATKFLLKNGADPAIRFRLASIQYTPFQMAARMNDEELVRSFLPYLRHVDEGMEQYTNSNRTAFSWACSQGHLAMAQLLLEQGANINVRNFNQIGTPLITAVRELHIEVVRFLLEQGADPAVTDYQRKLSAVEWGEAMQKGIFVSIPASRGHTPSAEERQQAQAIYNEIMELLRAALGTDAPPEESNR